MKKVKQILSLMLVIALALGMMSFAAAGPAALNVDDYKDFESIKNKEAVDVLAAIGILQGDENGYYKPGDMMTREQVAKVIAYVYAGPAAANLPDMKSEFDDVEDDRWSTKFIMFCKQKGIISGYGDGKFYPTEPVTASQMAKMLLMAVGYGQKEEYVGSAWEGNAIVDAQERGILPKSATANYTKDATRDDLALYTFSALLLPTAVYNVNIFGQGSYQTTAGYSGTVQDGTTTLNPSLAAKMFSLYAQPVPDDFGYSNVYWYQRVPTNRLTGVYSRDIVVDEFTLTSAMSKAMMFNDYAWDAVHGLEVWVNGTRYGADGNKYDLVSNNTRVSSSAFSEKGDILTLPGASYGSMPGVRMVLLDTAEFGPYDGLIDKVVVTYEYLARVEAVNSMFGTMSVTYFNHLSGSVSTSQPNMQVTGFNVGDYVNIIWKSADNNPSNWTNGTLPLSVKKADSMTTEIKGYTNFTIGPFTGRPNTITIGDKAYILSATALAETSSGSDNNPMAKNLGNTIFGRDIQVWFDSHGNIIGYDTSKLAAGALNYLYVTNVDFAVTPTVFDRYPARVAVIHTNGEREILELQGASGSSTKFMYNNVAYDLASSDTLDAAGLKANNWYAYSLSSNGRAHLVTIDAGSAWLANNEAVKITASDVSIKKGNATITYTDGVSKAAYATGTTLLSVASGGVVKTYTGYADFPNLLMDATAGSGDYNVLFLYALNPDGTANDKMLTHIFVVEQKFNPAFAEYGIVTGVASYTQDSTVFNVLLGDGSVKQFTVAKVIADSISAPAFVQINADNTLDEATATSTGKDVEAVDDGYFISGSDVFIYNEDCVFYNAAEIPPTSGNIAKPRVGEKVTIMAEQITGTNSYNVSAVIVTALAP